MPMKHIVKQSLLSASVLALGWLLVPVAPAGAQEIDVFYDEYGRRVILDAYTGEVIRIDPPQRPRARRAEPRLYLDEDGYLVEVVPLEEARRERPRSRERGMPSERFPDVPIIRYEDAPPVREQAREAPEPPPVERAPLPAPAPEPDPDPVVIEPAEPELAEPEFLEPELPEPEFLEPELAEPEQLVEPEQQTASAPALARPEPKTYQTTATQKELAALQVLLDRGGASPGVIDGRMGQNVANAVEAYNEITGEELDFEDAEAVAALLEETGGPAFTTYTITGADMDGPFIPVVPVDYSEKADLSHLSYTSVAEKLAERFHMDESYLRALNPGVDFSRPGTEITVANVGRNLDRQVVRIVADKSKEQVRAYGASGNLVAAYPSTIGSTDTPSPTGTHTVERIAFDPEYTYNPKINFQQGDNDEILTIPPGPNGPVGSIWIALSKPTYGIHGTPEPSQIGKTNSNGCVRLTNWDAQELAKLVKKGVTVEFVE
jgi:lipoprotein-anchoring transpeptidase ErfK/SrfK